MLKISFYLRVKNPRLLASVNCAFEIEPFPKLPLNALISNPLHSGCVESRPQQI